MRLGTRSRHLAAVLCADVAGYSRLMGLDEERTHARVQAHIAEVLRPALLRHGGRIVKTTGDGFFCEFPSAVDAVRAALRFQKEVLRREASRAPDRQILFRIGIHLGDIIADRGDLFGDDVNIAARLEAECEPGGLCLSERVHAYLGERVETRFLDEGERQLKNIARPVRVFSLSRNGVEEASQDVAENGQPAAAPGWPRRRLAAVAAALACVVAGGAAVWWEQRGEKNTPAPGARPAQAQSTAQGQLRDLGLVVLPFDDLSADPQPRLADALTESLTSDLAVHLPRVHVVSRNTAFTYKGKPVDVRQVGRELGVRYVLEGSIQGSEDRLRVNAQFLDAVSGAHVWAERFDVSRSELLKAQDAITGRIAHALGVQLYAHSAKEAQGRGGLPDAAALILKGRAAIGQMPNAPTLAQAEEHFRAALMIDPQSGEAMLGVAAAVILRHLRFGHTDLPPETRAAQLREADQLLQKSADSSPKWLWHNVKGLQHTLAWRFREAVQDYETSLALNPNYTEAYGNLARALLDAGELERVPGLIQEALRRSPADPSRMFWGVILGTAELGLGRHDAAVATLEKARAMSPSHVRALAGLVAAHALAGRPDRAAAAFDDLQRVEPRIALATVRRDLPPGLRQALEPTLIEGLRRAGVPEVAPPMLIVQAIFKTGGESDSLRSGWTSLEVFLDGGDRYRARYSAWAGEVGRSERTIIDSKGRFGETTGTAPSYKIERLGEHEFQRTAYYPTHTVLTRVVLTQEGCRATMELQRHSPDGTLTGFNMRGERMPLQEVAFERVTCRMVAPSAGG